MPSSAGSWAGCPVSPLPPKAAKDPVELLFRGLKRYPEEEGCQRRWAVGSPARKCITRVFLPFVGAVRRGGQKGRGWVLAPGWPCVPGSCEGCFASLARRVLSLLLRVEWMKICILLILGNVIDTK